MFTPMAMSSCCSRRRGSASVSASVERQAYVRRDLVVVNASERLGNGDVLEEKNDGRDRDLGAELANDVRVEAAEDVESVRKRRDEKENGEKRKGKWRERGGRRGREKEGEKKRKRTPLARPCA